MQQASSKQEEESPAPKPAKARNSDGWQRRLLIAVALAGACLLVLGAIQAWGTLNHHPELVYLPDVKAALDRQYAKPPPISKEVLDRLIQIYKLDVTPTCVVGKKYGALCQDGYVDRYLPLPDTSGGFSPPPDEESICVNHGGPKTWIECR
jgi:hypothetical protein